MQQESSCPPSLLRSSLVLKRDILQQIPEEIFPCVAPLLEHLIGDLDTWESLRLKYTELAAISDRLKRGRYSFAGSNLRDMRKTLYMPQRVLGKLIGVSRTSISYWENYKSSPAPEQRAAIGRLIHGSVDAIARILKKQP